MESDRSGTGGAGSAGSPTLVVGRGRRIEHANPAAEQLFRTEPGGLLSATMDDLVPAERRGELRNLDEVLAGGGARRLRTAIRLADGRRIDVAATLTPAYDARGEVSAVSVVYEPGRSSAAWLRSSMAPPAASRPSLPSSERRLTPAIVSGEATAGSIEANLQLLAKHVGALEQRVAEPATAASLDDPVQRARMLLRLGEMRKLIETCQRAARAQAEREEGIVPAAPKLPRF
jgi:hypothetical protein